jgi:ATP-dependent Clp protease ATP-binding subunit ClpC
MQDTTRVEQAKPEWAHFDERARNTMYAAREEARARNHSQVGTQDILAGLLLDPDCVAHRALGDLGVDVGALTERARTIVPPGPAPVTSDPALSPRAKNALTLAVDEARRLKAREIGTEHLLIGLLAVGDGMVHAALTEAGVTLDTARAAIQRYHTAG